MKDFYLVAVIGFFVGLLVLLPLKNIGVDLSVFLILGSVLGCTIFAPIALLVLKWLARFWPVFDQFGKFAAVGTLNALLDLGVLNLFIFLTNISSGVHYTLFKSVSFVVGTTNSYFWNKFWTFGSRLPVTVKEYFRFGAFTLVGTIINVSVASFIVNVIGAPEGMNPRLWANIGALSAVFVALFWNFTSYRLIVFKSKVKT